MTFQREREDNNPQNNQSSSRAENKDATQDQDGGKTTLGVIPHTKKGECYPVGYRKYTQKWE